MKFLPLLLVIISFSSCFCDKVDRCISLVNTEATIELHGFTDQDVDSIKLIRYERGSNYTKMISYFTELKTRNIASKNGEIYLIDNIVSIEYDWKLEMPGQNITHTINNLRISRSECKQCGKVEYVTNYDGFDVDGVYQYDRVVRFYK